MNTVSNSSEEASGQSYALTPEQRFEALKARFEDQSSLLTAMTSLDLRIFGGYISIQLAVGGFFAENPPSAMSASVGVALIDLAMAVIAFVLLRYNSLRRDEVIDTLMNAMEALGFNSVGQYIPGRPLNVTYEVRRWMPMFYLGVLAGYVGVIIVLFAT